MAFELVADSGADEVGSVGVEAVTHQEVDMAEIDEAKVDGDFFAVGRFGAEFVDFAHRFYHLYGWYLDGDWMVSRGGGSVDMPVRFA